MNAVRPLRPDFRVLIVDDHVLFAESLELALTLDGYDARRMPVPSSSGATGQLLAAALRLRPRIVLLDLDLGTFGDGVRLIHPLAASGANVVVLTASADRCQWGECLRYGARKAMSKAQPLSEVLSVVRRLHQGLPVTDAEERDQLLRGWEEHRMLVEDQRRRLESLTPREREVLAKLMEGMTVRDIARMSVVSEATVRTQVKSILAKLGVTSQLAAAGLAHNAGWRAPVSAPALPGHGPHGPSEDDQVQPGRDRGLARRPRGAPRGRRSPSARSDPSIPTLGRTAGSDRRSRGAR